MVVRWIGIRIHGPDAKLQSIKTWLISKLESSDASNQIGHDIVIGFDADEALVLSANLFFNFNVSSTKYPALIKDKLKNFDKTGLSIKITKYDDCSHDEDYPQKCVASEVYSWP